MISSTSLGGKSKKHDHKDKASEKPRKSGETVLQEDRTHNDIVWRNVFKLAALHLGAFYGLYLCCTASKWETLSWAFSLAVFSGFGTTGGAHRLWCHRSYKAKWPLRLFAAIGQTVAGQDDIYEWARNHRVHHKFTETDADPHNAKRGFFFAHMGWLMCKKHPEVIRCGKTLDYSDLLADPIVFYQRRFYIPLYLILNIFLPSHIPWYFWRESYFTSFFIAYAFRYVLTLHLTWNVNSIAHFWGSHPYDRHIYAAENKFVSMSGLGEGWHNYHHVFPWDYKAAELGVYSMNFTALIIDFFAWTGLAYNLRTVPETVVKNRITLTGDGSHRTE